MKLWVLFNKSTKISLNASSVYRWIKGAWHYAFLFSEGSFCFTVRHCHLLGVWENSNAAGGCLVTLSKLRVSDVNGKRQIRLSGNSWNITHHGLLRSRFPSLLTLQKAELDFFFFFFSCFGKSANVESLARSFTPTWSIIKTILSLISTQSYWACFTLTALK